MASEKRLSEKLRHMKEGRRGVEAHFIYTQITMQALHFASSVTAVRPDTSSHLLALRRTRSRAFSTTRVNAANEDSGNETKTTLVRDVSSMNELQDLIDSTKTEDRIAVLEVRRKKASPAVEAFADSFAAMATEFEEKAMFASLQLDKSEATKLAAKSLQVEEVPEFFIYQNGEIINELASGTSYEGLHHAVARSLGQDDKVG